MPAYPGSANPYTGTMTLSPILPTLLLPGDEVYLIGTSVAAGVAPTPGLQQNPTDSNVVAEIVAVGYRSKAVCLAPRPQGGPPGVIVQITATADPGASQVDIQDAAIDADAAYILPTSSAAYRIGAWTKTGPAVWTAWAELQPEGGPFVRLICNLNPNAVTFTAKIKYV